MNTPTKILTSFWCFYRDGFRNMTWGRTLWVLILIKLFIIFAILRLFFFQPILRGLSDEQKSDAVGTELVRKPCN